MGSMGHAGSRGQVLPFAFYRFVISDFPMAPNGSWPSK